MATTASEDYVEQMKTIEAVYEHGVLRPLEPLALPEGARVRVSVAGKAESDEEPPKKVSEPQKTPAEILAEIAALTIEGKQDRFSGRDHDKVLYDWNRAE